MCTLVTATVVHLFGLHIRAHEQYQEQEQQEQQQAKEQQEKEQAAEAEQQEKEHTKHSDWGDRTVVVEGGPARGGRRSTQMKHKYKHGNNDRDRIGSAMYMIEAFLALILLLLVGLWMSSAVAAGSMQISNLVVKFSGAALASAAVVLVAAHAADDGTGAGAGGSGGLGGLVRSVADTHGARAVAQALEYDWCKALVLVAVLPLLPPYLVLSFVNQRLRRCVKVSQLRG